MTQLYSDLVDGSGRRYYYSLNRAPGGASPASQALMTITGQMPVIFQQVSIVRTPNQAALSLLGYAPPSLTPVQPGVGSITISGLIPSEQRLKVITNALPTPDYSTPSELLPTIIYVQTITPATAALQIQTLTLNAFPGGDIVYVTPGVGAMQVQVLMPTVVNSQVGLGGVSISGLIPALKKEILVSPSVAALTINGTAVSVDEGFVWTDVISPPPLVWTTTRVSAS